MGLYIATALGSFAAGCIVGFWVARAQRGDRIRPRRWWEGM